MRRKWNSAAKGKADEDIIKQLELLKKKFEDAMNDDLNTPKALGIIYELIKKGYESENLDVAASVKFYYSLLGFTEEKEVVREPYRDVMKILSEVRERLRREKRTDLIDDIARDFLGMFEQMKNVNELYPRLISLLLDIRNRLRKEKDYDFADYIRKRLLENHILVDDRGVDVSTYRLEIK